ncbi:MAG: KEOPS complex N(6)-L-threonylcarbamoyladenine synthase Kae1 [Candidatus Micrarchaeota archaeon]
MSMILGIESTAHTFGVGIYDSKKDRLLSNEKAYYKPINEGIVPRKAAEHHCENAAHTIEAALKSAHVKMGDLDAAAYSAGPGLGPCLQVGASAAAFLAQKFDLPLVPVNHPHAHIAIARWQTGFSDPLVLYVSGGNTQIICGTKKGKFFGPPFSVMGETLDIGLGNLFDMLSREMGDEFSHGSVVAAKAMKGKNYALMPYTVKGMNFAFSGLFTYAKKLIGKMDENDLCYSLMETAFCELCEAAERALMLTGKKEVVVCGGVAQNSQLMKKVKIMAKAHKAKAGTCENIYNADNGAMIAYAGFLEFERGKKISARDFWADQKWRVDMVE